MAPRLARRCCRAERQRCAGRRRRRRRGQAECALLVALPPAPPWPPRPTPETFGGLGSYYYYPPSPGPPPFPPLTEGCRCATPEAATVTTADLFEELSPAGYCRTAHGGSGSYDSYYKTLDECMDKCANIVDGIRHDAAASPRTLACIRLTPTASDRVRSVFCSRPRCTLQ